MVFVVRFSLSPEDVDEAIEGLHGCLKIAILEVFRLLVQLKGSHFEPTLDCWQAGPCNFDGAGKGCVIFLAQRIMALKDYWKMARWYEMPFTFGSHTVLCFLQDTPCRTHSQNHSFSFEHPVHWVFEMRLWYYVFTFLTPAICAQNNAWREVLLVNSFGHDLPMERSLAWFDFLTCQLFDRNKASTTLYTLVLHYRYYHNIIPVSSDFLGCLHIEVRRSAYRHWRGTYTAIRCRMAPSCHLDPGTAGVYHGGNGHHKPYELHGWWRKHEAFEDIRES